MSGFASQVACLRLVANEPLFSIYAVPIDWPVLRQKLRIVRNKNLFPSFSYWHLRWIRNEWHILSKLIWTHLCQFSGTVLLVRQKWIQRLKSQLERPFSTFTVWLDLDLTQSGSCRRSLDNWFINAVRFPLRRYI